MSISYLLVLLGLAVFGGAIWALFWAVDSGQYEDLERQGAAILDDEVPKGGPGDQRQSNADPHRAGPGDHIEVQP
ncbi:MAG: cbb3-type cytochrome oxidase assembly protein CcoS [Pseudomonadota bacterium]